jgi:hypothetical protein
MTCRIKKARQQQELDALVFNVLATFRHQGALQWTDWHETTRARRGERGLGTTTFNDAVKRLMAQGRVQIDGDGCYRAAYGAVEDHPEGAGNGTSDAADFSPAENERSLGALSGAFSGASNGNADIADIALQQLMEAQE